MTADGTGTGAGFDTYGPDRVCGMPGCARPPVAPEPGAGRPPEYCDVAGHNPGAAWRVRQRLQAAATAPAPVEETASPLATGALHQHGSDGEKAPCHGDPEVGATGVTGAIHELEAGIATLERRVAAAGRHAEQHVTRAGEAAAALGALRVQTDQLLSLVHAQQRAQNESDPVIRNDPSRERDIAAAFVSITNALVDGHDIVDTYIGLTADCSRLLAVASAGLLLTDAHGVLHLMAASTDRAEDLEHFQLRAGEGPGLDCYRTGAPVLVADLAREQARWPQFAPAAVAAGFESVHALPMRLRDTVLGTLSLFGRTTGALNQADLSLAQTFAHVASVALVANRTASATDVLNIQLQTALDSRVILEQAKGILGQLGSLDMNQAFAVLRRYARDHNQSLAQTAHAVVIRTPSAAAVLDHARAKGVLAPNS